ncbi:MAG: dephospho-CoA kinase [Limnothrix sp. CACIAM 69d]|nr:MAG: dephospho-CoA kinase [Limnothrix sp. CACIAM 69d]
MRIIGLTGGIATGKTTVSDYLAASYGLPVLDADQLARSAVEPGSPLLPAIAQRFGAEVIGADGLLDRPRLGEIVFQKPAERQWLEAQIHPIVRAQLLAGIAAHQGRSNSIVLAIPLLFEAQMTDLVTEIWVVSCEPTQQLHRLMARNHLTVDQAQARINSQWPLAQKMARADVVLHNQGTLLELFQQVDHAWEGC